MGTPIARRNLKPLRIGFEMKGLASIICCAFALFPVIAAASDLSRREFLTAEIPAKDGKVTVAFFDADSTLRVSKSGAPSANSPSDYIILPGVTEKIAELNRTGILVAIVSNQAGIPKSISFADANAALSNMIKDMAKAGARVDYYDFAENYDGDRKPEKGMGTRLERLLSERGWELSKTDSYMVGDSAYKKADPKKATPADVRPDGRDGFNFSNSDRLFAENYGIRFVEPQYFFGWIENGVELIERAEDLQKFPKKARGIVTCRQLMAF